MLRSNTVKSRIGESRSAKGLTDGTFTLREPTLETYRKANCCGYVLSPHFCLPVLLGRLRSGKTMTSIGSLEKANRTMLFRSAFYFDTQPAGKSSWPRCRILDNLDRMHGFRGHPSAAPPGAGMYRLSPARYIADLTVRGVVANVRCLAPGVVAQKYTWPTVVMHRLG
jgi:hypothetical protein